MALWTPGPGATEGNDTYVGDDITADVVDGLGGNDTLSGLSGNDVLTGGAGNDSLFGGIGLDTLNGGDGNDFISGGEDADTINGGIGEDVLWGDAGDDTINGGDGNDQIIAGEGAEQVDGGNGDDTFFLTSSTSGSPLSHYQGGAGIDTLDYTVVALGLTYTASSAIADTFTVGDNVASGVERIIAGLGNDLFVMNDFANAIEIQGGAGNDEIRGALGVLRGGEGNDYFFENRSGAAMYGEAGDDRFWISGTFDGSTPAESLVDGGEGSDLLQTNLSFVIDLAAGTAFSGTATYFLRSIERVEVSARFGFFSVVYGSAADEVFSVNASNNDGTAGVVFVGRAGNDTLSGSLDADILTGDEGNDIVNGLGGNDDMDGGIGDDILDGGAGDDAMRGGTGNDVYVVDSAGDFVTEDALAGTDCVESSISYALGKNLENLTLIGTAAINGSGNSLNNTIIGNDRANSLGGGAGDDVLIGGGGNDILNGGLGNDTMSGGLGNDVYVVDAVGDVVTEEAQAGIDRVETTISYTLGKFVENLTLLGTAAISGVGNYLNNTLIGNDGANTLTGGLGDDALFGGGGVDRLNGGEGNDTMAGGAGNDVYVVDSVGDVVTEEAQSGIDRVDSSISYTLGKYVENLTLTGTSSLTGTGNSANNTIIGNAGANNLYGGLGDDIIDGGAGKDRINGNAGNDILTGGAGADSFLFTTALATTGIDTITDFEVLKDLILLDDAVFTGISTGALNADAFTVGAAASDALDRVIYDPTNGALYYDADGSGSGAAVQIATLTANLNLTAANIFGI